MNKNPYEQMISDCTWTVIEGITQGNKLRDIMHIVFNIMYTYIKSLPKEK